MPPKLFVATKAFVTWNGKVLVVRESSKYADGSHAGEFDIVGGRLTPGERFDEALMREIKEETGLDGTIGAPFYVGEWRPVVREEPWQIVAIFFEFAAASPDVKLGNDHDEFQWVDPRDLADVPLIPNLKPAFQAYLERRSEKSEGTT